MSIFMKRLTVKRYDEFLDALNEGFGKECTKWFSKELQHIYPKVVGDSIVEECERKLIESNYYVENDQEMVSGIALFKLDMKCKFGDKNIKLNTCGIGSVFTKDKARGNGLMTSNLKEAIEILKEEKFDLAWLSGDRHRYKNFGWDIAGKIYEYDITKKDVNRYCAQNKSYLEKFETNYKYSNVGEKNICNVKKLYDRYEIGVARESNLWKRQLSRPNLEWKFFESRYNEDAKSVTEEGYMVSFKDNKKIIVEMQGDEIITVKSLKNYMEKEKIENISIRMPFGEKKMNKIFTKIASNFKIIDCGMLKIIDPVRILEKIGFENIDSRKPEDLVREAERKMQVWSECFGVDGRNIMWWISDIDKV